MNSLKGQKVTATVAATYFQGLLVEEEKKVEPDFLVFLDVSQLKLDENNPDDFGNELCWILEHIPGHAEGINWGVGVEELGETTDTLDALQVEHWNETPRFYWDGKELYSA